MRGWFEGVALVCPGSATDVIRGVGRRPGCALGMFAGSKQGLARGAGFVGRTRTDSDHQSGMVHRAWSNGAVALVLVLRGLIRVLAPDSWEPGAWRAPSPQTFVCRGLIRVLAADSWKPGAWRAPREGGFRKKRKKERRREGERSRAEKKKEAHETPERKGEGRTKGRRRRSQGIEGAREYSVPSRWPQLEVEQPRWALCTTTAGTWARDAS